MAGSDDEVTLKIENLRAYYTSKKGLVKAVNNVSFVEWVLECVPPSVLTTSVPAELEINFMAEAFYEDRIRAICQIPGSRDTEFQHSLIREQDNRELARARTVWRRFE